MKRSLLKAGYVLLPLIVYYVAHDVLRILLMYILQMLAGLNTDLYAVVLNNNQLFSGIISALDMLGGAWAILFIMKRDYRELSIHDYVNLNGISFYRKDKTHSPAFCWILVMVQGVCASIGLNIILYLLGVMSTSSEFEQTSSNQFALPMWFGILLFGLISPAVEELVFRIVIYGRMKRCFPFVISVIVSSMFFGLYHKNLVQGIYGTLLGILMCFACEYLHTVVAAFVFHSVANLSVFIFGKVGVLSMLSNSTACLVFSLLAIITIIIEIYGCIMSRRKYGELEGVSHVGCFLSVD